MFYNFKIIVNQKSFAKELTLLLAQPEKAILDLLYLYPFYNTNEDLQALRLDMDFLKDSINLKALEIYIGKFRNKKLENRVKLLLEIYNI